MGIAQQFFMNSGEDAFVNHFIFTIVGNSSNFAESFLGLSNTLKYRVKNMTIPTYDITLYDVYHLGGKIQRAAPVSEIVKELRFTIRVDKEWEFYSALKKWQLNILNISTGIMGEDSGDESTNKSRINFVVKPIDEVSNPDAKKKFHWEFKGCLIKSIAEIEFDNTSGELVEVQVALSFLDMIEVNE